LPEEDDEEDDAEFFDATDAEENLSIAQNNFYKLTNSKKVEDEFGEEME